MKKSFTKKIIVMLMTVIMVVTSVPFVSFAVENGEEAPATNEQSVQESEEAESSIQNNDAKRGAQEEGADSDSQNVITRKGVQAAGEDSGTQDVADGDDAQGTDADNTAQDAVAGKGAQDAADTNAQDEVTENDAQDSDTDDDAQNVNTEKGAQDNDADSASKDPDVVNGAKNADGDGTRGVPDDAIQVSTWDDLYNACKNAPDNTSTTIVLSENITRPSDSDNDRIEIDNKKVIILDLNDKTLHANRTSAEKYYHVLDVHEGGDLTVQDSGLSGTIKGGYANNGGGIYISEGGTCTINGGTISKNCANDKGGGIYTEGTLIMTQGTISGNYASSEDGGGIYCAESGTIQLENVYIRENEANDHGSGIMIVLGNNDSYIQECYFEKNGFTDYSSRGGGIYVDADIVDRTLKITDSLFDNNWGLRYGGGIYLKKGTIQMTEGRITSNGVTGASSDKLYGGGVYVDTDQARFFADSVKIDANRFTVNGKGGSIYNNKGLVSLTRCTVTENKAGEEGGGIYEAKEGWLTLADTEITNNSAAIGGGVYFEEIESSDPDQRPGAMRIMGNTVVSDNAGSDVYLPGKMVLSLSQNNPLGSEANIGITHPEGPGTFTMDFERYMPEGAMPDNYFFSNDGYMVTKHEREGYLALDLDEAHKFLKRNERVNTKVKSLSPTNWMSGVSGEKYLNEINIPGTHDTAMNNVSSLGCLSGDIGAARAKTQKEYLFEQLDHGARFFDIRLKTYYCKDEISVGWLGYSAAALVLCIPVIGQAAAAVVSIATTVAVFNGSALAIYSDDGENLWACHGRSAAGTFYALDDADKNISFAQELEWFKEYLRNHPTETIIIDARPETDASDGETYYGPLERLKGILEEESTEINPSTDEPYIYWENGIVGKKFEHWPQMKDVRGKIVFFGGKGEKISDAIGGFFNKTDGIKPDSGKGGFKDGAKRGENLADFFETHNTLQVPRDAMHDQMEDFYWIKMNTTDEWQIQTPVGLAEKYVLPVVFGSDGYVNESKKGTYFGWFSMDAARTLQYRDVWITNFPDDMDYCTITVKSGLGEAAPDQVYKVLRGSMITIPGCIYDGDQADYFKGWKADVDNNTYIKNNKYRVLEDVTFTAQWSNDLQTLVTVVWKDAEDLDGIRPSQLSISYNDSYTETIKADGDWTVMLSGDLSAAPEVKDIPDGYTSTVEGDKGKDGYTITMTHTPDVKVNASGTVAWDDDNDKDGIRPASVTLKLYKNGGEEPVAAGTATAAEGWKFYLGTFPRYEDGELVAYRLVEEEISFDEDLSNSGYTNGVEAIEGEKKAITGFKVTNTHEVTTTVMYAQIDWDDDDDAAGERPESVTVQWLKDGEPYGEPIVVKPEEESDWTVGLKLTYAEMQKIAQEQDAIATKYQAGEMTKEEFVEAIENTVSFSIRQNRIDNYTTTVTIKKIEGDDGEETGSYYQILNTYEKHEHGLTETKAKAATCTEDGNTAYWTCDQGDDPCGRYFSDEEATTEIEEGSWIIHATGHDWGEWTQTKVPTCSAKGEKERICKNDASHKDTGEVAIDPDAHNWGEWTVTKEATETEEGSETRTCKNDPSHTETRAIPVLGHAHKLTRTAAVPATCTKDGNIEYWICDKGDNPCGRYFADSEGKKEINKEDTIVKAIGHKWGEWTQTKAPTCSAKGEKERICKNDASHKDTGEVAIDPDAHNWGEWTVTKEATETEEGSETRTCKNDPSHTETRAIPASIAYRNVFGDGNIWYKGSKDTSDFGFKRSIDDASTISHFTGILVDGKTVDSADYTKESGSVIVKLKPEYLETLSLGEHKLTAQFDDGNGSASANFTIAEKDKDENGDDDDAVVDDNGGNDSSKSAKTGDETPIVLWVFLLAASLAAVILLTLTRSRLRRKDR